MNILFILEDLNIFGRQGPKLVAYLEFGIGKGFGFKTGQVGFIQEKNQVKTNQYYCL